MSKRHKGEGTFQIRPDGRVMYQVSSNGRRFTGYGKAKTITDAKKIAKAKVDEKLKHAGEVRTASTIHGLFDEWAAIGYAKHEMAPTTFDQYSSCLRTKVLPHVGGVRVENLSKSDVDAVFRDMSGAQSSRRSTYAAFVKLMDYAVERGYLRTNVVRTVKRPSAASAAPRDISQDEALRILAAAKGHRWEVAVWLGLGAALRRGEMLGLTWADLDLTAGVAHIVGNVTRSSAGLRRGEPKTQRGRRNVPLPAEVVSALKRHRKLQAAERLKAGSAWNDTDAVLANETGGFGEPRSLSRVWAQWATVAGLADLGTHVGRHFAATSLVSAGHASSADIAAMLGHDPAVLLTTYASAVEEGQRAAATALGSLLTRRRPASK